MVVSWFGVANFISYIRIGELPGYYSTRRLVKITRFQKELGGMASAAKHKVRRRISVRRSNIHGRGVFASCAITKGERIIEYKGRLIKEEVADDLYGNDEGTHTFLFLLENKMVIDANYGGNSSRWINHSCDPNCDATESDGRMFIFAVRDIRAGEELTYDYNLIVEERYTPALKRLYACGCGARRCRGTILGAKR
jgi:SET domain-containing protein